MDYTAASLKPGGARPRGIPLFLDQGVFGALQAPGKPSPSHSSSNYDSRSVETRTKRAERSGVSLRHGGAVHRVTANPGTPGNWNTPRETREFFWRSYNLCERIIFFKYKICVLFGNSCFKIPGKNPGILWRLLLGDPGNTREFFLKILRQPCVQRK